MWQSTGQTDVVADGERALGRTEPPTFMFQPLRLRVLEHLKSAHGTSPKALTIVAPVGYGKTVLMSQMLAELRRTGRQCIWFALDDRDTSIEGVVSALQGLLHAPQSRLHPTQALFRGQPSMESRVDALVDLVNRHPLPLTLFIDNLNCCSDAEMGPLLNKLVFQTQASRQLVLSSTREIPLDMANAQLQGLVRQLGPSDLGFQADDIARLLGGNMAALIGRPGVEDIARQTEGWPAAVRMVQIILSGAEDPRLALKDFSGSDEGLARLLNRRVLSAFPAEVREFLLCIAQVRTFSTDLCRHVMDDDRAREHLGYLLERNVFVIPLDRNRNWYRLHGLFREFLLREAETTLSTARRQTVLTRAAHWCNTHGYWRESMEYALASRSAATASQILEHIAPTCIRNSGLVFEYIQWMESLHALGHQAGPEAEYWFVWALAFHRRYDYARRQSAALALRVRQEALGGDAAAGTDLQRRIAILRASIDCLSDHQLEAHKGAASWLADAGSGADDPFNLAAANCIECGYFSSHFHFVEARRAVQAARAAAFQVSSPYVDGWVAAYEALIQIYEGRFASAYSALVLALASTRAKLGDDAGICGTLSMVAAKCAAEMGLQEEAWLLFELGSRTARTHGFLESSACGLEAAVLLWQGGANDRVALAQLREIAAAYAPRLSLMLSCYLIRRMLVLGQLDEAQEEAQRIGMGTGLEGGLESGSPQAEPIPQLVALIEDTRVALLMAGGKLKQCEMRIAEELPRAKAANCALRLVDLSLASATLALRGHQHALAVRHVTQAVRIATPHGIVRPFQEQAETLAAIVADTKVGAWGFATVDERHFFVDRCRDLTFANQSLFDKVASLHAEDPQLLTQLTSREMELLGYIDVGLSNQQIADHIDVSLTTVKWHLQNLYSKLGVRNRSAALAKARVLSLL